MSGQLFGEQHKAIVDWLINKWWDDGPTLAIIQGFSGLGKTEIAIQAKKALSDKHGDIKIVHIDCPDSATTIIDDLILILAEEFNNIGDTVLVDAIDEGVTDIVLFKKLLASPRLIIIDEAQSFLDRSSGAMINTRLKKIFVSLSRELNLPGRILFLSNQEFLSSRLTERAETNTLYPLKPEDAQKYLANLLQESERSEAVPKNRISDVAAWLGGNPRAIRLLVSALGRDSLDELIGLAPQAWEAKDRIVSPDLLREFETNVLIRAIEQLDDRTQLFMRRVSVLRTPSKRKALEALALDADNMTNSRNELIARYIIEFRSGLYHTHPVVRDCPSSYKMARISARAKRDFAHLFG